MASDRNLPNLKLPSAPASYNQQDESQTRRLIEQHWHPQANRGLGNAEAHATVILPIDNGSDVIRDGMYVTVPITFAYSISGYRLIEDCGLSGTIAMTVSYASATDFDTFTGISGTQPPTILTGKEQERTALTGWTQTTGEAYSQLRATVNGDATNLTRVVLAIALERVDSGTGGAATGGGGGGGGTGTVQTWSDGSGVPNDANGNDGDYYLNDTTNEVYTKVAGHWTVVASLGSSSAVPTLIPNGASFTVGANRQALFALSIDVQGSLIVDGALVQVD